MRPSKLLGPSSGGMEYPQDLDAAVFDSIWNNVGIVGDDQFSCTGDPSRSTYMWAFFQLLHASEDMREEGFGTGGTFFRNVIGFVRQIGQRFCQPLNLHTSLWLWRDLYPMQIPRHQLLLMLV